MKDFTQWDDSYWKDSYPSVISLKHKHENKCSTKK